MNLKEYNWKIRYRSSEDDLLHDFYIPALERAVLYQRAAGYFSTQSLVIAARGIVHLVKNGGKMQLVVSPNFSEEDLKAIESGYRKKDEVIEEALDREFHLEADDFTVKRLEIVSWMIANDLLDIKVACPKREGKLMPGIYHEKVGIFIDPEGNYITFSGSPNESKGGYIYNFESFDVQCSWNPGLSQDLASTKKKEFEGLWADLTKKSRDYIYARSN